MNQWKASSIIPSTPTVNGGGWTLVKRHSAKKPHSQSHFTNSVSSDYSFKTNQVIHLIELDNTAKKRIHPESIQALIRTRITMALNQVKADQLCCFQPNTFRDIECNRYLPTEKQHLAIQKLLGVQLHIECTSTF